MTKIKICGLKRLEDVAFANELLPDYIGFVFAQKSKRYVSPSQCKALRNALSKQILAVGVLVDAPLDFVQSLLADSLIDIIQLHGHENEAYITDLRKLTDKPIIKAFRVDTAQDIEVATASNADYILIDNGQGGTGERFDWSLATKMNRQFFLAGGLTPQNVRSAIQQIQPYAVDTSSGVETDGIKDYLKMEKFIQAVRNA